MVDLTPETLAAWREDADVNTRVAAEVSELIYQQNRRILALLDALAATGAERDEFEAELHDRAILGDGYDRLRAAVAEERADDAERRAKKHKADKKAAWKQTSEYAAALHASRARSKQIQEDLEAALERAEADAARFRDSNHLRCMGDLGRAHEANRRYDALVSLIRERADEGWLLVRWSSYDDSACAQQNLLALLDEAAP